MWRYWLLTLTLFLVILHKFRGLFWIWVGRDCVCIFLSASVCLSIFIWVGRACSGVWFTKGWRMHENFWNSFSGCFGSRHKFGYLYLYFVCMVSVSSVKVDWKSHRALNLVISLILSTKPYVLMLEILFLEAKCHTF